MCAPPLSREPVSLASLSPSHTINIYIYAQDQSSAADGRHPGPLGLAPRTQRATARRQSRASTLKALPVEEGTKAFI